jgi:hypothetical protein
MREPTASVFGRLAISLGFLPLAMAGQAGHAQIVRPGYEPPWYHDGKAHYEKKEDSFGQFVVVRNVEDYREIPMLDTGPWITKESILSWHDSKGMIVLSFVDNGASVQFKAEGKNANGKAQCYLQGVLVGFDPKPSTTKNWQNLQPFIYRQLRSCTAITPADLQRAIAEMQASAQDYVSAANTWKSISVELFGANGQRCIRERLVKPFRIPPRYECAEYSKS